MSNSNDDPMENVDESEQHERFMREAIKMVKPYNSGILTPILISFKAELALAHDETPVGCVFVHKGEIIGRGMNDTNKSLNVRLFTSSIAKIIFISILSQYYLNIISIPHHSHNPPPYASL